MEGGETSHIQGPLRETPSVCSLQGTPGSLFFQLSYRGVSEIHRTLQIRGRGGSGGQRNSERPFEVKSEAGCQAQRDESGASRLS